MNNDNCVNDKMLPTLYSDATIQRCNRTACILQMQFKGLGVPNKYFAEQNSRLRSEAEQ